MSGRSRQTLNIPRPHCALYLPMFYITLPDSAGVKTMLCGPLRWHRIPHVETTSDKLCELSRMKLRTTSPGFFPSRVRVHLVIGPPGGKMPARISRHASSASSLLGPFLQQRDSEVVRMCCP